ARALTGFAARDPRAAAQAARVGDASGTGAARFDAAERIGAGDADAADALERLLLIAVDVALAEHVGDRAARLGLRAEQLEEAGRLHLLGEPGAALGIRLGLRLGQLGLLFLGELLLRLLPLVLLLLLRLLLLFLGDLGLLLFRLLFFFLHHHLHEAIGDR